jgi:hypothetical protein
MRAFGIHAGSIDAKPARQAFTATGITPDVRINLKSAHEQDLPLCLPHFPNEPAA